MKATKSNDVKVNEQQWDVWSVNNYHPGPGETAQVCIPGSYCSTKHGKLFEGVCCLAILWYQHKILRSFLNHLQIQHAANKSYLDTVIIDGSPSKVRVSTLVKLHYKFKVMTKPKGKQGDRGLVEFKKDLIVGSELR